MKRLLTPLLLTCGLLSGPAITTHAAPDGTTAALRLSPALAAPAPAQGRFAIAGAMLNRAQTHGSAFVYDVILPDGTIGQYIVMVAHSRAAAAWWNERNYHIAMSGGDPGTEIDSGLVGSGRAWMVASVADFGSWVQTGRTIRNRAFSIAVAGGQASTPASVMRAALRLLSAVQTRVTRAG